MKLTGKEYLTTWPDVAVAVAMLTFIVVLLIFLLKEIDSENKLRFACVGVIIVILACLHMATRP